MKKRVITAAILVAIVAVLFLLPAPMSRIAIAVAVGILAALAYKETLKCDILQVTHHGLNGGDTLMYSYVDPDICLWAIDQTRFETSDMCLGTKYGFEFNAWIRNDKIKVRKHYAASTTTKLYIKDL